MSLQSSALILAWLLLMALALGFAAVHRQLQELTAQVSRGYALPVRVRPGDEVTLPPIPTAADLPAKLVVFADASCRTCDQIVDEIATALESGTWSAALVVAWRADAKRGLPGVHLLDQQAVFDQLNVGVTPFVIALRGTTVVAAGHCGSRDRARRLLDEIGQKDDRFGFSFEPHPANATGTVTQ